MKNEESVASALPIALTRFFAALRSASTESYQWDQHGFLVPTTHTFGLDRLFDTQATLIVAPPWLGKTTFARAAAEYLRQNKGRINNLNFGERIHLTLLDQYLFGGSIEPPWWKDWGRASKHQFACWIVDALDEAPQREQGLLNWLLDLYRNLEPERRSHLRLLLLARGAELPKEVFSALDEIYEQQCSVVELLPLDRKNAEAIITAEHLDRTLGLIKRFRLNHLAGYPIVLEYLKKQQPGGVEISDADIWRGVLEKLLVEPNGLRPQRRQHEPEECFEAASHLAAALTFTGSEEILREGDHYPSAPSLQDLIPLESSVSRTAAREALKSSMFSLTPTGYRFVQRNVREWMCAFAVRDLGLERLRLLLRSGPREDPAPPRHLRDLAAFLQKTTTNDEVRRWLDARVDVFPSDAVPPSFDEAVAILDKLERLASEGEWEGYGATEKFPRLRTPGLGEELARRLGDSGKPPVVRQLILRVASAIGALEPAEIAAQITSDSAEDPTLRSWSASYLRKVGGQQELRRLIPFVEAAKPMSRIEKETVSILISAFLRAGIWGAQTAYEYLPEADPKEQIIDATRMLPKEIVQYLTFEDAVAIVRGISAEELQKMNRGHRGFPHQYSLYELLLAAAKTIVSQRPIDEEAMKLLIPLSLPVFDQDLNKVLREGLQQSAELRRSLFEEYVEREREGLPAHPFWQWTLTGDDLPWLEEKLPAMASGASFVWSTFVTLAHGEETRQEVRTRCLNLVNEFAPEFLQKFIQTRKKQEHWEQEEKARVEARKHEERFLQEIDEGILDNTDYTPQQRLWNLSRMNFLDPEFRPANVVGTWADLPMKLREEILDASQDALEKSEPTRIPPGRSLPGAILYEALAFLTLLRERPSTFELTSARISKWLPALLTSMAGSAKHELLLSCVEVDRAATEDVVLRAIERELMQNHGSALLQDLSQELWGGGIGDWVVETVESAATPPETRVNLLRLLGAREPEKAVAVAHKLTAEKCIEEILEVHEGLVIVRPEANIGNEALDILLALDPIAAWPLTKQGFEIQGKELLVRLPSLHADSPIHLAVNLKVWSTEQLVELEEMLFRAYPSEEDAEDNGNGFFTPDHQLRRLRFQIFELLFDRLDFLGREPLEKLSARFPEFDRWYRWRLSNREAGELLDILLEPPVETTYPPVENVVRALIESDYRLIREEQDLLDVVLEELKRIAGDAGEDLAMLYLPGEIEGGTKRRHEEALQLYIRRRLKDRLPGKVLERECEVRFRRRQDIKVLAPVVGSLENAVVVIEVKWSDNEDKERGVSTGLKKQLGEKYLLDERSNYGIFLVGWNGTLGRWHDPTIDRPEEKELPGSLLRALERQAGEFQREHPEIVVQPLVLDLSWPLTK